MYLSDISLVWVAHKEGTLPSASCWCRRLLPAAPRWDGQQAWAGLQWTGPAYGYCGSTWMGRTSWFDSWCLSGTSAAGWGGLVRTYWPPSPETITPGGQSTPLFTHMLSFDLLCVCERPPDWSFWFSQCQSILIKATHTTGGNFPTLCPGTSLPGTAAFMVKLSTPALLSESSIFCLLSSGAGCWSSCFAVACRSSVSLNDKNHRFTINNKLECYSGKLMLHTYQWHIFNFKRVEKF